ncbi:MAG TPA: hypothetical protein VIL74_11060 [Pyrinomonadaceae bacterium]|jgi:hypothetical protein
MLKKFGVKMLILAMIGLMAANDALAQARIRFARGRSSASVSSSIAAGGSRTYVLGARSGQTLNATLSCGNGNCDFGEGERHDTSYSEYVDRNGDVYITVHNHGRRATNFTMTVSIQ